MRRYLPAQNAYSSPINCAFSPDFALPAIVTIFNTLVRGDMPGGNSCLFPAALKDTPSGTNSSTLSQSN
jgi:hypothetical protein